METIVKIIFGSHLYGTATEGSDQDYKGIFLPSKEQIFLNRIPKSISFHTKKGSDTKNSNDDIDTEIYSLHYFLKLAIEGETVALDMLHTPDNMLLETSNIWKELVKEKHRFYTKNLKAFVGYCRKQASKYSIRGSRLNDAQKVLDYCSLFVLPKQHVLKAIWKNLPTGEHIFKHEPDVNGVRMYEVCGRRVGETATIDYLYNVVKKFYDNYGERARQASNNENVDFKAVSHAFRAAYQTKQILEEGTITFPLKEAGFLKQIKLGQLHFANELSFKLDNLMDNIEQLSAKSNLPEKVDQKYWDNWLIGVIEKEYSSRISHQPLRYF